MPDIVTGNEWRSSVLSMWNIRHEAWARKLYKKWRSRNSGGLEPDNKPFLFEVRYANALHLRGHIPVNEFDAGMVSTVDFHVPARGAFPGWLIELVKIDLSKAVLRATKQEGPIKIMELRTDKADVLRLSAEPGKEKATEKQINEAEQESHEGELLVLQSKILEKVWRDGKRPIKFPEPTDCYHCIVIDVREFADGCGTTDDFRFVCLGASNERIDGNPITYKYRGQPIKGLWSNDHPLKGAAALRERVHFLHFILEKETQFQSGQIAEATRYISANPHLIPNHENARRAWETYPLFMSSV